MSASKSCPIMGNKYVLIGIGIGLFLAGLAIGYAIFLNTYNPYSMMMQNSKFSQTMLEQMKQNHDFTMNMIKSMMNDPTLRTQMIGHMMENQEFMTELAKAGATRNMTGSGMMMGR